MNLAKYIYMTIMLFRFYEGNNLKYTNISVLLTILSLKSE